VKLAFTLAGTIGAMQSPTRPGLHPTVSLFLKLTAVVAIAIVVLVVTGYLLKILIVAALIAAVLLGGFFLYNFIRRRQKLPIIR
jgi:Flp pilus assembly protein TadB